MKILFVSNFALFLTKREKMEEYFNVLLQEIERQMSSVAKEMEGAEVVRTCREMVSYLKEKIRELKLYVLAHPFRDTEQEIRFFKYCKPALVGRLLYYYRVFQIESGCPPCRELAEIHYKREMERFKMFMERYLPFHQYYRSGATYRDNYYFCRRKREISPESGSFLLDEETEFSTGYDRLAARLISVEMVFGYLSIRQKLLGKDDTATALTKEYHWTDKKAAAVELIYGIYSVGSVDNGKVEIAELVKLFETTFHIDLGDVYHTFIAMRNRKNSRTVYLDQIKEKLLKRMDETDS